MADFGWSYPFKVSSSNDTVLTFWLRFFLTKFAGDGLPNRASGNNTFVQPSDESGSRGVEGNSYVGVTGVRVLGTLWVLGALLSVFTRLHCGRHCGGA